MGWINKHPPIEMYEGACMRCLISFFIAINSGNIGFHALVSCHQCCQKRKSHAVGYRSYYAICGKHLIFLIMETLPAPASMLSYFPYRIRRRNEPLKYQP